MSDVNVDVRIWPEQLKTISFASVFGVQMYIFYY